MRCPNLEFSRRQRVARAPCGSRFHLIPDGRNLYQLLANFRPVWKSKSKFSWYFSIICVLKIFERMYFLFIFTSTIKDSLWYIKMQLKYTFCLKISHFINTLASWTGEFSTRDEGDQRSLRAFFLSEIATTSIFHNKFYEYFRSFKIFITYV